MIVSRGSSLCISLLEYSPAFRLNSCSSSSDISKSVNFTIDLSIILIVYSNILIRPLFLDIICRSTFPAPECSRFYEFPGRSERIYFHDTRDCHLRQFCRVCFWNCELFNRVRLNYELSKINYKQRRTQKMASGHAAECSLIVRNTIRNCGVKSRYLDSRMYWMKFGICKMYHFVL